MDREERNSKNKSLLNFKASMHIGMGVLYMALAAVVIYFNDIGKIMLPTGLDYAIATLMVIYGGFRIWRGITQLRQNM